jgi:hypothetical protein
VVSSQLPMFRLAAPQSSLLGDYVACLLVKQGEREALEHLTQETLEGFTPLLRVLPPELRTRESDIPPTSEFTRIAGAMGDRAVYLDVAGTPRRRRRAKTLSPEFVRLQYEAAQGAGLTFAPVYPFGRSDLASVIADATDHELGAALSIRAESGTTFGTRRFVDNLRDEVRQLRLSPAKLDLIVDIGYLSPGVDESESVIWLIGQALEAAPWRSAVLLATSVPDSLADHVPDGSVGAITLTERSLYASIAQQLTQPVRFGDYAVQHPVPPAPGAVPAMRASIRYPAGNLLLVSRGAGPLGEKSPDEVIAEYKTLAEQIRRSETFDGLECCWGDRFIFDIAESRRVARGQHHLRAVGTCHHITRLVADGIPGRLQAPHVRQRSPQRVRVSAVDHG